MPIKLFESEFVNFQTMSLFMVFNTGTIMQNGIFWNFSIDSYYFHVTWSSYFMKQEWVTKCFLCVQIWLMQKFW